MRVASLLALAALVAVPRAMHAAPGDAAPVDPKAEADRLIAEAGRLAGAGDLLGAATHFRAASAFDPRPVLICNAGIAFYKARDLPRAQLYLVQCLTRAGSLDAPEAAKARAAFATVEDLLRAGAFAPIDVSVVPETAAFTVGDFDREDVIVGGRVVWLPFGHHTLTARAEGYVTRAVDIELEGPAQQPIHIALDRTPDAVGPGAGSAPRRVIGPGPGHSRRGAVIATVATGGLGLGALAAYLLARSAASDAGERGLSDDEYDDLAGKARFRQHLSWGLGGAAVAGAAISGWLWYRATRTTSISLDVTATDGGAATSIRGTF